MAFTAGQKLGSLLVPLYLLALLAGAVAGAAVGLVASLIALVQFLVEPEVWASWGPGWSVFFPVVFGIPIGGVLALAPATGSIVGLFAQAWNVPHPSIKDQSLVAGSGAGVASAALVSITLFHEGTSPQVMVPVGIVFALVSSVMAWRITARYLHHRDLAGIHGGIPADDGRLQR